MGRKSRAANAATQELVTSIAASNNTQLPAIDTPMSPAMQEVISDIDRIFSEVQETSLRSFWRVGELISRVSNDPALYLTDDQRVAGVDAGAFIIGVFAPVYTAEQLRQAVSFYEAYPREADVIRLLRMRCPERPRWRMTVSHVQLLTQVNDPDKRAVLEDKCAENAVTARNLALELQEIRGKVKNSGRKHRSPRGLKQQLLDLLEHQRKFISRSEKLWLAEDADETVYDTFINTPIDEIDAATQSYFQEISDNFDAMLSLITIHKRLCVRIDQELFQDENESSATEDEEAE